MDPKHTAKAFYLRKCAVLEKIDYLTDQELRNIAENAKTLPYEAHKNQISGDEMVKMRNKEFCIATNIEYLYQMLVDPTFTHDKWNKTGTL